jgi:MFS family permease
MDMSNKVRAWSAWIGTVVCGSLLAVAYGGPALLYNYILENTGCAPAQFGLIFSAMGVGLMLGSLLAGKALEMNNKLFSIMGTFSAILLYGSIWLSKSITIIIACGFLFGFIFQFCGNIYFSMIVTRWFNRGRGKALSIGFVCQTCTTMVLNPLLANLVIAIGGSRTALIMGGAITGINFIMMAFVVGGFPDRYGMQPIDIGKELPPIKNIKPVDKIQSDEFDCSMPAGRIALTPAFILLFISVFFIASGTNIYFSNSVMLFQSFSLEYTQAAFATSIVAFAGMVINLICGFLADHIGAKKTIMLYAALGASACLLTPLLRGWPGSIIFALLISCCGISQMAGALTVPKLFGINKSGTLMGWLVASGSLCSAIVGPIATGIYGATGSYAAPMVVAGIAIVAAIVMVNVALSPKMESFIRKKDAEFRKRILA